MPSLVRAVRRLLPFEGNWLMMVNCREKNQVQRMIRKMFVQLLLDVCLFGLKCRIKEYICNNETDDFWWPSQWTTDDVWVLSSSFHFEDTSSQKRVFVFFWNENSYFATFPLNIMIEILILITITNDYCKTKTIKGI